MSIIRDITINSKEYLQTDDILLYVGARQAGKTTILKQIKEILEQQGNPCFFIDLEDPEYLELLNKTPKNLFKLFSFDTAKKNFVFIDEIQYLNNPSNFLKFLYDEHREKIKIIASGSSAFYIDEKFKDSLAGRKKIFNVFTLSFKEFLRFKGENEIIKKDFDKLNIAEKEKIDFFYREYLIYGGYPKAVLASSEEEKKEVLKELAYSYIKKDIFESRIKQDEIFYKLFKILSSQIGNLLNSSELASTLDVSKTAIDNYLYVMQKSFHIRLVRPFFQNMRKEMVKMPKFYFLDTGLRNFFTGDFSPFEIRKDKGELLENAAFRGLINKYDFDDIRYWRTIQKNEIDFVVEGQAFEVKTDPRKFKPLKYKKFFENYPDIKFAIVSYEAQKTQKEKFPVKSVLELNW